jgi:putative addiction module component (TIGR02574 family)
MNINAIEQDALHLPLNERARLAQKLLASLDDLSEAELEQLWLAEAQPRAEEIDQGQVKLVSAEELEERVQARLK